MDTVQRVNLYVTFVEKKGPFLKIWGQTDKNNAIYVEQFLAGLAPQFDLGVGKLSPENITAGTLICAKYKDNKYYRAKILNNAYVREGFLEVSFIDFGNKEIVACGAVRSLQNLFSSIASVPSLAVGFIFAEAHCVGGGEWNDTIFDSIAKEIKYREVQCTLQAQAAQYYLVRISVEGNDLCNLLIQKGLMQPISLQAQQAVLLSMSMQKSSASQGQQINPSSGGINTYKTCTLEPGCQYPVYVSYVNDGPCHFSIQLKQTEDVLVMLMNDINSINLRLLEDIPIPGTICLARCQEDGNICRAVVTNEVDTQFKVFYVDFGNYEVLPLDSLYQIPFKYVLPKVMALRFSLAGVEKPTVTIDMQVAFKKFVDNRLLHMKVLPSPTRTALPKCELWDPETKTSALDVVIRAAKHSYPEPVVLARGFSQSVKISFVYSCNRFYVQLVSKEEELSTLMSDLQEICKTSEFMETSSLKSGVPCCALFSGDELWYRSQVVTVSGDNVKVRYIDFGNEEVVPASQLKAIDGEILTVLRPQAIECCLNGYQKMEPDEVRDALLEELILEGVFTMKVVDMCDKKALVDLFDGSNYNVASLLLDKLAVAKSQVSPVLAVQAGNKIEHRKSYSKQREQIVKGDKNFNTVREHKTWDKPNDRNERNETSWRQDNREIRNYDKTNDNNEKNSWRQNNKGFSPNSRFDKYKKPDDTWNSTENTINNNSDWNSSKTNQSVSDDNWNDSSTTNTSKNTWNTQGNDGANRKNNDYKSNKGGFQDKGARGGFNNDRSDRGFKNDRGDRGGFNDRGDRGGFNDRGDRGGFNDRSSRSGFNDKGDRFGGKSKDGGFKQRDFRKDGSEMSSSGSEKSFHKGPRTSSRSDQGGRDSRRNYDKSSNFSGGGDSWNDNNQTKDSRHDNNQTQDSWNVSAVVPSIDAAPTTATFVPYEVVGTKGKIIISWFHNPGLFYCQQMDYQEQFKTMMDEIHEFYKNRKPEQVVIGAPAIGLFPEDNVLYRARILEVIGTQYKVQYVDYGNVSTISKVWPIDKRFMNLPSQAIACALNGIGPIGEQWADPDNYSSYFDKDNFVCNFVNKDEEKTFVNILHNSEDVAQLLVKDGLAVSTASDIPDIEIPMLVGQQFRAVVKSVNNLSDIILALECGLAVNCTMHNLESATEIFEDVLKGLLEQAVIVYVDNVLEDYRLEITLYDSEGNKHIILNPDEGAYETVDVPCPAIILRSVMTGYVPFADETSIFLQPAEHADQIASLLDEMFETYDEKPHENTIIPEEGSIYAVHSEDGNWYRGKVISFDDETVLVCYVDYGNSESVTFEEIRDLEKKFLDISLLSLQIAVESDAVSFIDKDVTVNIYYGASGWEGAVQLLDTSVSQVPLPTDSVESTDTGFATSSMEKHEDEISDDTATKVIENKEILSPTSEEDGDVNGTNEPAIDEESQSAVNEEADLINGTPVIMSHIDTPCDFYLQFADNLDDIEQLQIELQENVEAMDILENPVPGVLCAAPYSVDQQWYRAEVLDADEDITTVRFVDFGNTDVIDNKTTQIKTLPPKLLSLAIYATRCSLKIEPMEEEWSSIALGVFEQLSSTERLTAEFLDQDEKCSYVNLYSKEINIQEALLNEKLARPAMNATETKQTGFVSHLNSPSEFWIQLESCVDELEWIAEQLSTADTFPELVDLNPGTLCAALFPDDQMWYRARILSNTVAGVELLFIDYGNSCTSADLKQLPEDLVMTAPLAMKCSLKKNEGIPTWTPEAAEKFADISADGQTIFTVKKISTGETSIVQLFLDDKDVTSMLLPSTEEGYVKEIENLEKLTIEKNDGEKITNVALEPLDGQDLDDKAKEKLEELNDKGTTVFQIEFVNEKTVRLYLNGKDIRPLLGTFRSSSFDYSFKESSNIQKDTITSQHYEEEQETNIGLEERIPAEGKEEGISDEILNKASEADADLVANELAKVEDKGVPQEIEDILPDTLVQTQSDDLKEEHEMDYDKSIEEKIEYLHCLEKPEELPSQEYETTVEKFSEEILPKDNTNLEPKNEDTSKVVKEIESNIDYEDHIIEEIASVEQSQPSIEIQKERSDIKEQSTSKISNTELATADEFKQLEEDKLSIENSIINDTIPEESNSTIILEEQKLPLDEAKISSDNINLTSNVDSDQPIPDINTIIGTPCDGLTIENNVINVMEDKTDVSVEKNTTIEDICLEENEKHSMQHLKSDDSTILIENKEQLLSTDVALEATTTTSDTLSTNAIEDDLIEDVNKPEESNVTYESLVDELVTYTEKIKVETKDFVSKGEPDNQLQESSIDTQIEVNEEYNVPDIKLTVPDENSVDNASDVNRSEDSKSTKHTDDEDISEAVSVDSIIKEHTMTDSLICINNLEDETSDSIKIETSKIKHNTEHNFEESVLDVISSKVDPASSSVDTTHQLDISETISSDLDDSSAESEQIEKFVEKEEHIDLIDKEQSLCEELVSSTTEDPDIDCDKTEVSEESDLNDTVSSTVGDKQSESIGMEKVAEDEIYEVTAGNNVKENETEPSIPVIKKEIAAKVKGNITAEKKTSTNIPKKQETKASTVRSKITPIDVKKASTTAKKEPIKVSDKTSKTPSKVGINKPSTPQSKIEADTKPSVKRTSLSLPKDLSSKKELVKKVTSSVKTEPKIKTLAGSSVKTDLKSSSVKPDVKLDSKKLSTSKNNLLSTSKSDLSLKKVSPVKTGTSSSLVKTDPKVSPKKVSPGKEKVSSKPANVGGNGTQSDLGCGEQKTDSALIEPSDNVDKLTDDQLKINICDVLDDKAT